MFFQAQAEGSRPEIANRYPDKAVPIMEMETPDSFHLMPSDTQTLWAIDGHAHEGKFWFYFAFLCTSANRE